MDNKIAALVDKKHYVCGFLENSSSILFCEIILKLLYNSFEDSGETSSS